MGEDCMPSPTKKQKMSRTPFVGGNWKMNMPPTDLLGKLNDADFKGVEVVCAPPTVHLLSMKAELTKAVVCAQNCYSEPKGAFTGETSPDMLVEAGVNWVLLGHSERR